MSVDEPDARAGQPLGLDPADYLLVIPGLDSGQVKPRTQVVAAVLETTAGKFTEDHRVH